MSGFDETGAGVCRPSFLIKKFYTETMASREFSRSPANSKKYEYNLRGISGNHVVDLQGLVHDGVPFRTRSRAPFAILAEGKIKRIQ
jgi:hypothetical protein